MIEVLGSELVERRTRGSSVVSSAFKTNAKCNKRHNFLSLHF